MKRNCIIVIVFIIFLTNNNFVLAQNDRKEFEPKLSGKLFVYNPRIQGSQFYLESWVKSNIKLNNGIVLKNKLLNYNGYLNKFIWINDLNLSIILDDYSISEVCLIVDSLNTLVFTKIFYAKNSKRVFGQLISDDKVKLYAYRNIVKDQDVEVSNKEGYYRKVLIRNKPIYIFIFSNEKQVSIDKLSSRQVIKAFPENEQFIVKEILRKYKLKIRSENDLIRFNILLSSIIIN